MFRAKGAAQARGHKEREREKNIAQPTWNVRR